MTEHGGAAALKQNNLAALRSALYHTDFATKKELAEQCRLSLAACTALLGEMIDDGQVLELAFAEGNRLGVPVILETDAKSKCDKYVHLGMELAGTRDLGMFGKLRNCPT